jgi:hypothetical protein
MRLKPGQIAAGIALGAVLAGGGYAIAATRTSVIHGCINKKTHALTVVARCPKGSTVLTWNRQGRVGARGPRGASGSPGTAATVSVGTVTTGGAGSQASVTNVGTASNVKLNFTIPQGQPGSNGSNGTSSGPTAYGQVWMGSSAAELAPNTSHNLVGAGSAGVGGAVVDVQGCSSAGLAEPVIEVTADKDSHDTLAGANNTANVADAYVSGWSTEPDTSILVVDVDTTNPVNGAAVDSDFSITVTC